LSHRTCGHFCMHVNAVSNSVMLQLCLQHDFYNIIFKIKQIIYSLRVSAPLPPMKNYGCAPVCTYRVSFTVIVYIHLNKIKRVWRRKVTCSKNAVVRMTYLNNDTYIHLGFYTAQNGSFLPTFRDNLSVQKHRQHITILCCIKSQNSADLLQGQKPEIMHTWT
jgi:hypothetical protein